MKFQEALDRQAESYDRSRDSLIVLREFADARRGEVYDPADIGDVFIRRLISTKFVSVITDGIGAPAPAPVVEAAPAPVEFVCDAPGCTRAPFNTKLKLASHARIHKD